LRVQHPEVPWPRIIAFRNILVHAYFAIDWDEVWRAARARCPVLREQVAESSQREVEGLKARTGAEGDDAVGRTAGQFEMTTG